MEQQKEVSRGHIDVIEVLQLLKQLQKLHFYGALELKLEAGKIVYIRKIETLKAGDLVCLLQQR